MRWASGTATAKPTPKGDLDGAQPFVEAVEARLDAVAGKLAAFFATAD